jgi:tetratricopeptide (TPR) repeat protein
MSGYTARDVAKLLALSPRQVHGFVRAGFLDPERGPRGELRFGFQDLVILRTAKELIDADIPTRRVRQTLRELKEKLPTGRSLTGVTIAADGRRIVVNDSKGRWYPDSGQMLFNFEVAELARKVAPLAERSARALRESDERLDAEEWYEHGCELEHSSPKEAREAYRRAVELDPDHVDAHVNLGRLLHEDGELEAAEAHYRIALRVREEDATAAFNLGVVLDDAGRDSEALEAYESSLAADRDYADAHFNLARLYERLGQPRAAVRHWTAYRALTRG